MLTQLLQDALRSAPLTALILTALGLVLVNAFLSRSETLQRSLALLGLLTALVLAGLSRHDLGTVYGGMLMTGGFASVTTALFCVAAILTILISEDSLKKINAWHGEFHILVVLAVIGMIAFANGRDLIALFIGLEVMSICLFVMAGFTRRHLPSNEASLKYFLLGAFASGFLLYGIALIYGTTQTTELRAIAAQTSVLASNPIFLTGIGLLVVGLAFKVGAAPFHMWVPDVYEGAPTAATAFMSTGAKAAAFSALLMVFNGSLALIETPVNTVLALLSVLSMLIGNIAALVQTNVKRMLAYSSIAHAGYVMIGLAVGTADAMQGVLVYLTAYVLTNIGTFGVVSIVEKADQSNTGLDAFAGLGRRRPFVAALMSIFLFSLIGLPPTAGFFGKYSLFLSAVQHQYTWLAIVGVVASVISVYYYLRIMVVMYFSEQEKDAAPVIPGATLSALVLSASGILLFGFLPSLLLRMIGRLF